MSHGTVTLMRTSSSLTTPKRDHIVLLVPCQPSTGLFPHNGHPLEDWMNWPLNQTPRNQGGNAQDAGNEQSTSPADRMTRTRKTVLNRQITTTQRSKGCRRNVPKCVVEMSDPCRWNVCRLMVCRRSVRLSSKRPHTFRYMYASCVVLFRWEIFTCAAANITLQSTLSYWRQHNISLVTAYRYRAIGNRHTAITLLRYLLH